MIRNDPFLYIVRLFFSCYTILLFLRILSSWFPPEWRQKRFVYFLAFYTDPYLNIFRRLLPPLGGVLDLSPMLAFFILKLIERLVIGLL